MPEPALRRLADDAERAVELPGFADLVHRARRRRRRRHAAIGISAAGAAVLVASALFLPGSSGHRSAPPVTGPNRTAAPSPQQLLRHPADLVNQPGALLASVSYASPENAATLWQVCNVPTPQDTCPEVLTWTTDGWRSAQAARIPDKLAIYDLPDGSVLVWLFDGGFLLDAHGHRHHVTRSAEPVAARPGGRYVDLPAGGYGEGPAGMLDTRTDTVHRPLTGSATECVSDARWGGGILWEYGTTRCALHPRQSVAWTHDLGRTWSTRTESHPVLGLQSSLHRTAILLGGPTGRLQFLDVTDNGGSGWRRAVLHRSIPVPDSYAGTPDGHLFVTSGSRLYAADPSWTSFQSVAVPDASGPLGVTAANGVVATFGAEADRIAVSYDDGQTWHSVDPRPAPPS